MVVWNDERWLFGASQFQPPSSSCSPRSRLARASFGFLKYEPMPKNSAVDTRLGFAVKIRPVVQPLEDEPLVDPVDHFAGLPAGGVETEVHQDGETVEGNKQVPVVLRQIGSPPTRGPAPVAGSSLAGEEVWSPQPSVATRERSAANVLGAPVRSLITCQRMDGSESRSHLMCAGRSA